MGGCTSKSYKAIKSPPEFPPHEKWKPLDAELEVGRYHHATVFINDTQMLIIGGVGRNGSKLKSVELYDTTHQTMTQMASLSTAREAPTASIAGGYVYICGGYSNREVLNTVERIPLEDLTPETQWESVQPMNDRRKGHSSAIVDGKMYVFGGESYREDVCGPEVLYLKTAEYFNEDNSTWYQIPKMPSWRIHSAVVVMGQKIFLFGGMRLQQRTGYYEILNSVVFFDMETKTWGKGPNMPIKMPVTTAVAFEEFIVVIGTGDTALILNTQTDEWKKVKLGIDTPRWHQTITFQPTTMELIAIGGWDSEEYASIPSMEKISFWTLTGLKWKYLRTRILVDTKRAIPKGIVETEELDTVKNFFFDSNDDEFRNVLEFVY
jgi:hypothetical protein